MTHELVLHHYDGSPFGEKVRLMLGYKGLAWRSVRVPVIMPKPDVLALTGGYRRTPFMQIGADVYCDTALMCRVIDALQGKPSHTRWRILGHDAAGCTTRVELAPITGRTHQLRVHLAALGHPILGDALYADAATAARTPRLLLHATRLAFAHPASGSWVQYALPAAF